MTEQISNTYLSGPSVFFSVSASFALRTRYAYDHLFSQIHLLFITFDHSVKEFFKDRIPGNLGSDIF